MDLSIRKEDLEQVGRTIADRFLAGIRNLNLAPEEVGIVSRASLCLAECAALAAISGEQARKDLAVRRDLALAALGNLAAAKAVQAEVEARRASDEAIAQLRNIATAVLTDLIRAAIGVVAL